MKIDIIIDISPPIPYLAKFWFSSFGIQILWAKKLSTNQIAEFFKCNMSRMD